MSIEFLDVLDENGNYTGEAVDREVVHSKGLWHREVAVWIFNNEGQILLQRRSANKKHAPNKLGICEGHVKAGMNPKAAGNEEVFEELGESNVTLFPLAEEKKEKRFGNQINRIFNIVFFGIVNKNASDFTIQEDELSEVLWIDYPEFKKRVIAGDEEMNFQYSDETKGTFAKLDEVYKKLTEAADVKTPINSSSKSVQF